MGTPQTHSDNPNVIGAVVGKTIVTEVVLSLDTNQYGDGDVLAATQEIANFFRVAGGYATPYAIEILDEDAQGGALELLFFDSAIDVGTENNAYAITDTEMRSKIGRLTVAAADYSTWTNHKTAFYSNLSTGWKCGIFKAAAGSTSLFIAAISKGTSTYSAAGLRVKIHAFLD